MKEENEVPMLPFPKYRTSIWILSFFLVFCTVVPLLSTAVHAAVPKLDDIRVALFIKARGTVPAVTLTSSAGLTVGIRTPSEVRIWAEGLSAVRSTFDQYAVSVVKTADYDAALRIHGSISPVVKGAFIFQAPGANGTMYEVVAGPYAARQEAHAAMETLKKVPNIMADRMHLQGNLRWNAGSYDDLTKAEERQQTLANAGLDVHIALHEDVEGRRVYSVMLGSAMDEGALDATKNEALASVPGLQLSPMDAQMPYLLMRTDVTDGAQSPIPFYGFNPAGQKMWVTAAQDDVTIQVKERSGRTYRGGMELSQYSGELAVINELPFESYLYSVVGSEMVATWPLEALKAQAVAARSFALAQGMKYGIAHVSDTTFDQAYYGTSRESPASIAAVDATKGEILIDKNGVITAFYYSNAGGLTADYSEIWSTPIDYVGSVPSPDHNAEEDKLDWVRVVLPNGEIGYVRSDFTKQTGKMNAAGFSLLETVGTGVNVRHAPYVDNVNNAPIAQINEGDVLIEIERTIESNPFSWVYGPYNASELLTVINKYASSPISGPLEKLAVTQRGPSGRVTEMVANGLEIKVSTPDSYRSAMKGLPSTRFDVEEMGSFTIAGAKGALRTFPEQKGDIYVLHAEGSKAGKPVRLSKGNVLALNDKGEARVMSLTPQFRFVGYGFGHGIGMSQYGAKEMAEFLGYDYQKILLYYYRNVDIVKGT